MHSDDIGLGHFKRCLNISNIFKKQFEIVFIFQIKSFKSFVKLRFYENFNFKIFVLDNDKDEIKQIKNELLSSHQADLIIIDKYDWKKKQEIQCKLIAKKIMVIEDLPNRKHCCDYLLDFCYGRNKKHYQSFINKDCKLLLGLEYLPISKKITNLAKKKKIKKELKNILISFGGVDEHDMTSLTIKSLMKVKGDFNLKIVINKLSKNYNKIKKLFYKKNKIEIVENKNDLIADYFNSDICIGASGFSSWERCSLGLPSLVIITANNQKFISDKLKGAGAICLLGEYKTMN